MNKKLGLAVAGAVMAFGASAANAGIIIPAGDWTIDIGGNVNTYYTNTRFSGDAFEGVRRANQVSTGLLPSALGIGGKTRQNDLDIAFQFTFFVGANADSGFGTTGSVAGPTYQSRAGDGNSINIRQAYLTFGDASWGTIKAGRDLGLFGSDAILSDMTLLGVGVGAGGPGNSTLGRIGSGYVYADWIGQIQYASPNWNGFSFAVAAREGLRNNLNSGVSDKSKLGFDGKVSYEWTGDVSGKVWAGYIYQKHEDSDYAASAFLDAAGNPVLVPASTVDGYKSRGYDIGGKINIADFGLVGYYYKGKGLDLQTGGQLGGLQFLGANKTDDKGGYVQATYKLPTVGTKLGVSYGISKSDDSSAAGGADRENKSWIVGAYHPLTKSLNLVAEYAHQKLETDIPGAANVDGKAKTISLGAILFF